MTENKAELGPKKVDREPGVKGPEPEQKKTVNVLDLPTVQCKCDNITWYEVKILKTLTVNEEKKEVKHVIVDAIACTRCGSILSDGVPVIRLRKEGE